MDSLLHMAKKKLSAHLRDNPSVLGLQSTSLELDEHWTDIVDMYVRGLKLNTIYAVRSNHREYFEEVIFTGMEKDAEEIMKAVHDADAQFNISSFKSYMHDILVSNRKTNVSSFVSQLKFYQIDRYYAFNLGKPDFGDYGIRDMQYHIDRLPVNLNEVRRSHELIDAKFEVTDDIVDTPDINLDDYMLELNYHYLTEYSEPSDRDTVEWYSVVFSTLYLKQLIDQVTGTILKLGYDDPQLPEVLSYSLFLTKFGIVLNSYEFPQRYDDYL